MSKETAETSIFLAKFKKQIDERPLQKRDSSYALEIPSAFRSVFAIQELDQTESLEIQEILEVSGDRAPEDVQRDFTLLKNITAEIKSIQKQSILLIGERIFQARNILKLYGDGSTTFTKWVDVAFSSRRTAYNSIAYFEFYQVLPNDLLRQRLKLMSHKAVYMLASRGGDLKEKIHIIEECYHLKQDEIIPIIQKTFPVQESEKRRQSALEADLQELERALGRVLERREHLNEKHRQRISTIQTMIAHLTC